MWLDKKVSVYSSHIDNTGFPSTYRDILFSKKTKLIDGLRKLEDEYDDFEIDDTDYRKRKAALKSKLKCFAVSALLESRAHGNVREINRTGVMQLDFDYPDIKDYDIEEAKQGIFNLPFIGFCGLSCSGKGFYALALIAEPERLKEYAEHCFYVLENGGIKVDTSKGRNITDLRYFSYDSNPLIREDPEILHVRHFRKPAAVKTLEKSRGPQSLLSYSEGLINSELSTISKVQVGQRWETVQKVSFTLGGLNDGSLLELIKKSIKSNDAFSGEEIKYLKCAKDCFIAGMQKPLQPTASDDFNEI